MRQESILMELYYLAPVSYYSKLLQFKQIILESQEHYQKRSYRNRCAILSANGTLHLSIPLQKGKNEAQQIRDVRISNVENWQKIHWQGIVSAYGKAPFFEFYADYFNRFYVKKFDFLFEFNLELLMLSMSLLGIKKEISFTNKYDSVVEADVFDARRLYHPRKEDIEKAKHYSQVFEGKFGFVENLSILDLLMCRGNEANSILIP